MRPAVSGLYFSSASRICRAIPVLRSLPASTHSPTECCPAVLHNVKLSGPLSLTRFPSDLLWVPPFFFPDPYASLFQRKWDPVPALFRKTIPRRLDFINRTTSPTRGLISTSICGDAISENPASTCAGNHRDIPRPIALQLSRSSATPIVRVA